MPLLNGFSLIKEDFGYWSDDDDGDNTFELYIHHAELTGHIGFEES